MHKEASTPTRPMSKYREPMLPSPMDAAVQNPKGTNLVMYSLLLIACSSITALESALYDKRDGATAHTILVEHRKSRCVEYIRRGWAHRGSAFKRSKFRRSRSLCARKSCPRAQDLQASSLISSSAVYRVGTPQALGIRH